MKQNMVRTFATAAIACACIAAPIAANAQRGYDQRPSYGQGRGSYRSDNWSRGVQRAVDRAERESNSFRSYFEHNFRSRGHARRWDPKGQYDTHPEHAGRNGEMSLQDAIQNLDEDFERLRTEVDHHGRSTRARDLMDEITDHANDVDRLIDRVADTYSYRDDRNWRYDRSSELYTQWRDLKGDVNDLARQFNIRGR